MTAYYNENDPYAARWLRNLISAGHIMAGDVDERSITEVKPDDLKKYTRCHFFAGIGGWDLALKLAGWPADRPVWTGSCPCQPFSVAGKGKGKEDGRHLWPIWLKLIKECRPDSIFGEQVEAAIKHGWLNLVQGDLEGINYSFGAAVVPAACVGAPHIRHRLWFMADSNSNGRDLSPIEQFHVEKYNTESRSGLGDSLQSGLPAREQEIIPREVRREEGRTIKQPGGPPWVNCEWVECRDGKKRPIKPGVFPLANGVSGRVGQLRAYGNAIVPQVAAEIIKAYMEIT